MNAPRGASNSNKKKKILAVAMLALVLIVTVIATVTTVVNRGGGEAEAEEEVFGDFESFPVLSDSNAEDTAYTPYPTAAATTNPSPTNLEHFTISITFLQLSASYTLPWHKI